MKFQITIEVPREPTADDRYPHSLLEFRREIAIQDLDHALEIISNISQGLTEAEKLD